MSIRSLSMAPLLGAALLAASLAAAQSTPAAPAPGSSVSATPAAPAPTPSVAPGAAAPPAGSGSAPVAAPGAAAPAVAAAAPAASASAPLAATLDGRIQDLKSDVIKLNRDLLVLEEELLFPASTQVALFVSMDVGKLFELDSLQVRLDDKVVASYLYTPREVQALHRGGVQRVWLGNLRTGAHELVAFFTGRGPHERDYKRGATVKFEKGSEAKYIELRIRDSLGKLQPEFEVKVWQ